MKKKLFLTTSLCAVVLSGAICGSGVANAETINSYPSDFTEQVTFSSLSDYAVSDGEYAFLDGNKVTKLGGGNYESIDCGERVVTAVDCVDDVFYCSSEQSVYTLSGVAVDIEIERETSFTLNNYYYYFKDGSVKVLDERTDSVTSLDGFSILKKYGQRAYAVKENVLYALNGSTPEKITLEYYDYSSTLDIAVGDTADKLKTFNAQAPHFVRLKKGAYLTEIDSEKLEETFKAGKTVKVGAEVTAETALLLCKTGSDDGISIIMITTKTDGKVKSQCYMLRTDDTVALNRNSLSQDVDKTHATATVSKGFLYSSPYVCGMTQLKEITAGDLFEIIGIVKSSELVRDFYLVKYTDESNIETTGYVPLEYVSLFTYIEKDPAETVDPDYSEEDNIKPVVLIIIVIALVLIALGYMVFVGTSKKKNDKNVDGTTKKDKKKKNK